MKFLGVFSNFFLSHTILIYIDCDVVVFFVGTILTSTQAQSLLTRTSPHPLLLTLSLRKSTSSSLQLHLQVGGSFAI